MGELDKYKGFKAELAIAETLVDFEKLELKAKIVAEIGEKEKIGKREQDEWGIFRCEIKSKKGAWLKDKFPKGKQKGEKRIRSRDTTLLDEGITKDESSNARLIYDEESLVEEVIEEIKESNDVVTPNKVAARVRKKKKDKENIIKQDKRKQKIDSMAEDVFKPQFLKGRFQDVCESFSDNYFDHIITDPPYPKEFLDNWSDLSEVASRILKPGGFCICYSGKFHLPEVIKRLSEHLEYYWQLILLHKSNPAAVHPVKINTLYKPILIFQKPPHRSQENYVTDLIQGTGREKFGHEWQQGEEELTQILESFTLEGELILDPFAGSGTTGFACQKNKRRSILIDINDV